MRPLGRSLLSVLCLIAIGPAGCKRAASSGSARSDAGPAGALGGDGASGGTSGSARSGRAGGSAADGGRSTAARDAGPDTTGADAGTSTPATDAGASTAHHPACMPAAHSAAMQAPAHVRTIAGETGWFASPLVADLDGDGVRELIVAEYSLFVYDASGKLLDKVSPGKGRVYAPHVIADLDHDGAPEIVFGNAQQVFAYGFHAGKLVAKPGWPVDTTSAGQAPEVRGLAAADLDGDGTIEVVATTTQTASTANGGAQVFVWSANGTLYQPKGLSFRAWPRYNAQTGPGNDADRNGQGHSGYGCYGLNVGIGNIDDDPALEIVVTYDNHAIQAFDPDGVALDASDYFTNPASMYSGQRLTWGQFIRWADPQVEADHYHTHTGDWPSPTTQEWLQWTASPPSFADLDGDGHLEVIGAPNIELHDPYVTQAYGLMALQGAFGDGSRSAMRLLGWETLPRGTAPLMAASDYPPLGVPAVSVADLTGDGKPELIAPLNDGFMYAFSHDAKRLFRFDHRFGKALMYASEASIADLNGDGSPEIVFATYGDPDTQDSGQLVVLDAGGKLLYDVPLPGGHNGNGNGAPAAPTIADLDGDGSLEIFVQSFDHGLDQFSVPGSSDNCLLWPTARGGPLRTGSAR